MLLMRTYEDCKGWLRFWLIVCSFISELFITFKIASLVGNFCSVVVLALRWRAERVLKNRSAELFGSTIICVFGV